MRDNRRTLGGLLVAAVAVPVVGAVYLSVLKGRLWAAARPTVATLFGTTVLGAVYAEIAIKRAPATPLRAPLVLALAFAFVVPAATPAPAAAGYDPAEAVISAGLKYVGQPFRLGSEGPRFFDCSGLIFRIFADAGELPRIGGQRLLARGYTSRFVSRGSFGRNSADARRGDLVAYTDGRTITHMGIYLGSGKVLSALTSGVTVHRLNSLNYEFSVFLRVNWTAKGKADGGGNGDPGRGRGPAGDPDQPDRTRGAADNNGVRPGRSNALASGTLNLRLAPDPKARIVGLVGRGDQIRIVGRGRSPAGYLWYEIKTRTGKSGWVYSHWVRDLRD